MQSKKDSRKREKSRDLRLEDILVEEEGIFDEEDEDSVTDDTLEFLSLDDDMIEEYNRTHSTAKSSVGYEDEDYEDDDEYEDEDYEDEDDEYEDEDYEDDDDEYEDEDYEDDDDEYEDEDYEDDDDEYEDEDYEEDGVIVRFKNFLSNVSTIDMIVAVLGIVVLAGVLVTGSLYATARMTETQVEAFASVGQEIEGISVIGEGGLIAVSESARLADMMSAEEEELEQEEEQEDEKNDIIEVSLHLTSIQSDIKIKFVNKETGKLIGSVPFEVEVTNGKKTFSLKDEDKDGIIYQTGIDAGSYQVTIKPLTGTEYEKYKLPTQASSVEVTDTIAYKKVDVADEVKTEAEVNVAAEDTAQQNTVVESTLKDTVEWVESTKTPIEGEGDSSYEKVSLSDIPNPWTVSSAAYKKMVETGAGGNSEAGGETGSSGTGGGTGGETGSSGTGGGSGTGGETSSGGTGSGSGTGGETGSGGTGGGSGTGGETGGSGAGSGSGTGGGSGTGSGNSGGSGTTENVSVALDKTSVSLKKGESASVNVVVTGGSASSVAWSSSNSSVASVSGGSISGVGAGTATVKASVTAGGKNWELSCSVTVTDDNKNSNTDNKNQGTVYTKVTISGTKEVAVGKTITLQAVTDPKDGKITWSSENEKTAKVDQNGVVTGVAEGKVKIKATCKNQNGSEVSDSLEITVKAAIDGTLKLKDKDGNQLYYRNSNKEYIEATYDDYGKKETYYKKTSATKYKYTGWQTIDGHVYFYDKNGNVVTGEQVIQGAKYNFGSDGKLSSNSGSMGIDVSKWNGSIDWNAVKNSGVSYVIIRCGYRGSSTGALIEDPKFKSNIKGAKAAGLKVGAYFFSQAVNEVEAVEEASMAVNLVSGYGLNYPIFLDVESSGGRGDGIDRETRTAVCKAFCATVQNSGYSAGVYANKTWFTEKINTSSLTGYKIWLAQYASAPTYTATRYDMWQYSSKGKVSGISGNVDMNISYMNY